MMEGFIMVILKNNLRECREAAHINQKELAAQIGIARETIGKLERGDNQNPCYRLVYEVASYFGKPVEEIFQYEDASE